MANNYLQLELGGQKRGLKFVIGTVYHAQDATELSKQYEGRIPDDLRHLAVIVYSSLLSNYESRRQEQDFTFEDVLYWVKDIETAQDVETIIEKYVNINKKLAPVEGAADTRLEAAHS